MMPMQASSSREQQALFSVALNSWTRYFTPPNRKQQPAGQGHDVPFCLAADRALKLLATVLDAAKQEQQPAGHGKKTLRSGLQGNVSKRDVAQKAAEALPRNKHPAAQVARWSKDGSLKSSTQKQRPKQAEQMYDSPQGRGQTITARRAAAFDSAEALCDQSQRDSNSTKYAVE